MKNIIKIIFAFILLFLFMGCPDLNDNNDDNTNTEGLTLTGIPSNVNGKLAISMFSSQVNGANIVGAISVDHTGGFQEVQISGNNIVIPQWQLKENQIAVKFSGTGTYSLIVIVHNQNPELSGSTIFGMLFLQNVRFTNGNARISWNQGNWEYIY